MTNVNPTIIDSSKSEKIEQSNEKTEIIRMGGFFKDLTKFCL